MPLPDLLGVFGGTFDPVHTGHLRLAEEAREGLGLAEVRWIPAGNPAHRDIPGVDAAHRLAMVRLAVAGNSAFTVDASEVESPAPSFTVPTLERLRAEDAGERALVLLLGADAFAGLPTWHRWRDLFSLAHIAVFHRPGFPIDPACLPAVLATEFSRREVSDSRALRRSPAGGVIAAPLTPLAISATRIRQLVSSGGSPRYLLPEAVVDYIDRHRLYRPA